MAKVLGRRNKVRIAPIVLALPERATHRSNPLDCFCAYALPAFSARFRGLQKCGSIAGCFIYWPI